MKRHEVLKEGYLTGSTELVASLFRYVGTDTPVSRCVTHLGGEQWVDVVNISSMQIRSTVPLNTDVPTDSPGRISRSPLTGSSK